MLRMGFFEILILASLGLLIAVPILIVVFVGMRAKGTPPKFGPVEQRISCPKCGAGIIATAAKCRFCGAWLNMPAADECTSTPAEQDAAGTVEQSPS